MSEIRIPPAALEAGARALADYGITAATDAELARVAFLAMIENWEGMSQLAENDSASIREMAALILPLTQENSDDQ